MVSSNGRADERRRTRWGRPAALVAGLAFASTGCSVGVGEGRLAALVWAPECELEGEELEMPLTFFAADPVEEIVEIRAQHGSDFEDAADGVAITVHDANRVQQSLLGQPIDLSVTGRESVVTLSLFLNATCKPSVDRPDVVYVARSGTITFTSIYAPQLSRDDTETAVVFDDVELDDGYFPERRHATIEGDFRFLFNRGRPAQRFP